MQVSYTVMIQTTDHYCGLTVTAAQATAQTAAFQSPETTQHSSTHMATASYTLSQQNTPSKHHSTKAHYLRALNATTGEEIWTINSYVGEFMYQSYAIADGYNTWFNGLTNEIYVVGRGPSQTTVTAPNLGAASGQSVLISGSVTDIATGTTQNEQAARFPNGLAASSDASMKDWMGYVYQQKPLPTNFTGVEVVINVVDANGNFRTIGTAQTDATGQYSLAWKPDISGKFTVIATFAGTKGYWSSSAETAFVVDEPVRNRNPTTNTSTQRS